MVLIVIHYLCQGTWMSFCYMRRVMLQASHVALVAIRHLCRRTQMSLHYMRRKIVKLRIWRWSFFPICVKAHRYLSATCVDKLPNFAHGVNRYPPSASKLSNLISPKASRHTLSPATSEVHPVTITRVEETALASLVEHHFPADKSLFASRHLSMMTLNYPKAAINQRPRRRETTIRYAGLRQYF